MAWNHQEKLCMIKNAFVSERKASMRNYKIWNSPIYEQWKSMIPPGYDEFLASKFVVIDSTQYRPGLMVIFQNEIYEIVHIIAKKDEFMLLCHHYLSRGYVSTLNSVEIYIDSGQSNSILVNIDYLDYNQTFEKIILREKYYIYADTFVVLSTLG